MPTYVYQCTGCGLRTEKFQRITEPALTECEGCAGRLKKVMQPVGIAFKGSGFYVNDSTGAAPQAETPVATETKPEATPEPSGAAPEATPSPPPTAAPAPATTASSEP